MVLHLVSVLGVSCSWRPSAGSKKRHMSSISVLIMCLLLGPLEAGRSAKLFARSCFEQGVGGDLVPASQREWV